jgi:hypothetical protein
VALSSLHHVIDLEWMKEAYRLTRKDGAPGIDGVTAADYATNLEAAGCPTPRDFVPWRFSDAGRISVWLAQHCRRPKT